MEADHPPRNSTAARKAEVTIVKDNPNGTSSTLRLNCNGDSDLLFDAIP